jgi:hypothetical protein
MEKESENIIYSNFNRKNKWLGIIDYKSILFIISYIFVIYYFLSLFKLNLTLLIYLFMFLTIPVVAILCVSNGNESLLDMIWTIIIFKKKCKIYVRKDYIRNLSDQIYKKN